MIDDYRLHPGSTQEGESERKQAHGPRHPGRAPTSRALLGLQGDPLKPISDRLRAKILRDIQSGMSQGAAARRAKVAPSTVSRLLDKERAATRVAPKPEFRTTNPSLTDVRDAVEDFDIPATDTPSGMSAELAGDDAPLAGGDAVVSEPRSTFHGYREDVPREPITVVAPNGEFPTADPWPPRELSFAGQAALLRVPARPKHPDHPHSLMTFFQNGR